MTSGTSEKQDSNSTFDLLKSPLFLALVLLSLAYFPILREYLAQQWSREYYQFFPFALATTFWFATSRAAGNPDLPGSQLRQSCRAVVFVGGSALTLGGALGHSPLVGFLGFVLYLGLLLDLWREQCVARRLCYTLLPTLLVIRPPFSFDETAIQYLQQLTSSFASDFLNALRIDHILIGNVIQPMTGPALLVEEACSGVQSLFTVMFIAAFIGVSREYSVVRTLLLISSAVFWALLMNIGRVMAIAIAQTQLSIDLTAGWRHDAVGYAAMLAAIPLLLSTDRFIQFLFGGIPDDPRIFERINPFVSSWNLLFTAPSSARKKSGSSLSSEPESIPWSTNPKLHKAVAVASIVIAALCVLPAWILPGFLR